MDFSATTINRVYNLVDGDRDAYRALFRNIDYHMMMQALTRGRVAWKRYPVTPQKYPRIFIIILLYILSMN